MKQINAAAETFRKEFSAEPTAYGRAPGRVEILGNHTDYNEGFILSAAIDRHTIVCGRRIDEPVARIHSQHFSTTVETRLDTLTPNPQQSWVDYPLGVIEQLTRREIQLGGFEAVVLSDVPGGAGLSSSAALEIATALLLKELYPYTLTMPEVALLCQAAENQFVGMNCGILDQFTSCMGKRDHLLFLDCRDLKKFSHIPLGNDVELVLANTCSAHELVEGTYNRLREDCFRAAAFFAERLEKTVTHLRDVTPADLATHGDELPDELRRCADHIIGENDRVLQSVDFLRAGDRVQMGQAMSYSHRSSRDRFNNSCAELDIMIACAEGLPGGYGGRLSGGGFGGCTANLVTSEHAQNYAAELAKRYQAKTGITPEIYICKSVDGATSGRYKALEKR